MKAREKQRIVDALIEYQNSSRAEVENTFLVRACFAYDDMVAALEGVVKEFSEWEGPEEDVTKGTRAPAEARNRSVRAYEAAKVALAKARKKE